MEEQKLIIFIVFCDICISRLLEIQPLKCCESLKKKHTQSLIDLLVQVYTTPSIVHLSNYSKNL